VPGLRRAFRFRLGAWYAMLFLAAGALLLAGTYLLLSDALRQRDRERVTAALEKYIGEYARGGPEALRDAVATDGLAGRNEGVVVRLTGPGGAAVFASVPSQWQASELEIASARLPEGVLFEVGKSSEARADILRRFRARAALAFAAVLALALAGGAIATRSALAPVRRLADVLAQIVRTGKPSARVLVRGDGDPLDELGRLANEMLDRIEGLVAGMKDSLDHVAHDLRTPLQRLRATAETALRADQGAEAARAALVACIEECDRVASMLTTLMDISEAETGAMTLRPERLDVSTLLRETAELYEHVAEDAGVELAVQETAGLEVPGDRARLRQALANLVDNALKYTPRGGHVCLRAHGEDDRVVFECADDGPGIPGAEQPRIWERLYRGEQSRASKGLGLGLSLVRSIARAHGGEATVESREGGGATFRLELPASASITQLSSPGKTAVRRTSV